MVCNLFQVLQPNMNQIGTAQTHALCLRGTTMLSWVSSFTGGCTRFKVFLLNGPGTTGNVSEQNIFKCNRNSFVQYMGWKQVKTNLPSNFHKLCFQLVQDNHVYKRWQSLSLQPLWPYAHYLYSTPTGPVLSWPCTSFPSYPFSTTTLVINLL